MALINYIQELGPQGGKELTANISPEVTPVTMPLH